MSLRLLPNTTGKFDDPAQERVRRNIVDRIDELQNLARNLKAEIDAIDTSGGGGGAPSGTGLVRVTGGSYGTRAELSGDVTTSGALSTTIAANAVSNTKLRDSAALSVIGRASNSVGDPADIVAATDGYVLQRVGSTVAFGSVPGLTAIGLGFFGDASDGSPTFDGVTTVLGAAPTTVTTYGSIGSIQRYLYARDIHLDTPTIASGVAIITTGRVFIRGTLIGPASGTAYIGMPGSNGAAGNAGSGGGGATGLAASVLGAQAGGGSASTTPTNGGASAFAPPGFSNTGGTAGTSGGGNGVSGGAGRGGGSGGSVPNPGATGGVVTIVADSEGSLSNLIQAVRACTNAGLNRYTGGSGGAGGANVATGNGFGGGGGAGGGGTVVCAREITNASNVVISAFGGNGGNAYQGAITAGQKLSPGCGGGGGWAVVVIGTGSFPSTNVAGGTAGLANPTAGVTSGDGGAGLAKLFRVGA